MVQSATNRTERTNAEIGCAAPEPHAAGAGGLGSGAVMAQYLLSPSGKVLVGQIEPGTFFCAGRSIRMAVPPMRLEVMNAIEGIEFTECYTRRNVVELDGTPVNMISLADLKKNKSSTARNKDKSDLDYLP
jgi:hypothetical protein